MMAGNTWKAKTTPILECCLPISPKTNSDPAYEKLRICFTMSPSVWNSECPKGTSSTKMANASCRPTPHATTCQLIAPRLRDNAIPIPRMSAIPKIPVRRCGIERGAACGTGASAGASDGAALSVAAGC